MDCIFKNTIECEDIVVIDDSDDELCNNNEGEKLSSRRKKSKRKVTLHTVNKTDMTDITQKVEVKKQAFKCVINFNTNVSDFNCSGLNQSVPAIPESKGGQRSFNERIVPTCWRLKCKGAYHTKQKKLRDNEGRKNRKICEFKQRNSDHRRGIHKTRDHTHNKNSNAKHHSNKDVKFKECYRTCLSPISMTSLKSEYDVTHDEVSMDSFSSWSESGNLDTLIKRTREREKQNGTLNKSSPISTSQGIIYISDSDSFEEKISIYSEPSLILEQPSTNLAYSLVNAPDLKNIENNEECKKIVEYDFKNVSKAVGSAHEDQTSMKDAFKADVLKLFNFYCDSNGLSA